MRPRPIRLTYVITDLQVGGVPLHLHRLATALSRDTFQVRVISLADVGPVGRMLQESGIPVDGCGARGAWDLRALGRLGCLLGRHRPDVVHSLLFHANVAARLVGPWAGVPAHRLICEIQTAEIERPWHLVVDNLTCRLCRFEVGNSPSVVEHLYRRAHVPRSRLRCEWGAVDIEVFARADPADRASLGVPADEPLVVWTGRLDPVKGFEEMLAAFARVVRERPAHLLLAGEGDYRPAVERLVAAHRLGERVHLLGRRSDVPALLRAADAFLFCSRTEGLPNALLEAMAAGLPIVATDVPGCRDVIRHRETGLLASRGCDAEIAGHLLAVLADRPEALAMGLRAREHVRREMSLADLAQKWSCRYRKALGTVSAS